MSPFKKLASQTAIYGLPTIVGRLLSYLLTPLYTYLFVASEYGVVTSLYSYVSFFLVLLTYGMETALFRFSQTESDKGKVYTTALISLLGTSVVFIAFMAGFAGPVADLIRLPEHPEYILWLAIILGADAIAAIPFARLREQNKALRFAFIRSVNIALNILLNVFFIWFCRSVYEHPDHALYSMVASVYDPSIGIGYIFISNLISSLFTLILLLPELFRLPFQFDAGLWKKMLWFAVPLLIGGLAGMVNETMDRILLTYLLPADEAMSQTGIYGACYKIAIIMTIFIQTFRFAAEPFFFARSKEKDSKQVTANILKYFTIVCSLIFLGTMMNLSWIQYFIGEEYREGLHVVPILLLANLFLGIYINQSIWYKLTGLTRFGIYFSFLGALITLVLNFYWIPRIGYTGSAWATLICYGAMMIASWWLGHRYYPVPYELGRISGYLALSLLLFVVSGSVKASNEEVQLVINNSWVLLYLAVIYLLERKKIRSL